MIGVTAAGRPGAFGVNPHHLDEVSGAVSRTSRNRDGQTVSTTKRCQLTTLDDTGVN